VRAPGQAVRFRVIPIELCDEGPRLCPHFVVFFQWRRRMRLMHALRLLAAGRGVTEVGLEVGYSSTSAFIAAFKRELGTTPFRYYVDERITPA